MVQWLAFSHPDLAAPGSIVSLSINLILSNQQLCLFEEIGKQILIIDGRNNLERSVFKSIITALVVILK